MREKEDSWKGKGRQGKERKGKYKERIGGRERVMKATNTTSDKIVRLERTRE